MRPPERKLVVVVSPEVCAASPWSSRVCFGGYLAECWQAGRLVTVRRGRGRGRISRTAVWKHNYLQLVRAPVKGAGRQVGRTLTNLRVGAGLGDRAAVDGSPRPCSAASPFPACVSVEEILLGQTDSSFYFKKIMFSFFLLNEAGLGVYKPPPNSAQRPRQVHFQVLWVGT